MQDKRKACNFTKRTQKHHYKVLSLLGHHFSKQQIEFGILLCETLCEMVPQCI